MKQFVQKALGKVGYQLNQIDQNLNDISLYRTFYSTDSIERRAFYNISAGGHFGFGGKFSHPCWTNIDVDNEYAEINNYDASKDIAFDPLDLSELPLESKSAELFHSRYTIEHITDEASANMFKEIYRCLKKDGVFKIVVPNFELDYVAFMRKDIHYFSWIENFSKPEMMELMKYSIPMNKASLQQVFIVHFAANASTMHSDGADNRITDEEVDAIMNNNTFEKAMDLCTARCSVAKQRIYRQNHINWWSYDKVKRFLNEAGFNKVYFQSPKQSVSPVMRNNSNFDNLWNNVALFIEGVK